MCLMKVFNGCCHRLLFFPLVLLLVLLIGSCRFDNQSSSTATPSVNGKNALSDKNNVSGQHQSTASVSKFEDLTLVGRWDISDHSAIEADWPSTMVGATFKGSSKVVLNGIAHAGWIDTSVTMPYFNVYVDGQLTQNVLLGNADVLSAVTIATNLDSQKSHVIWLSKRSDGTSGSLTFVSFQLDNSGVFLPPPAHLKHRMEFIGDSGFMGYGVDTPASLMDTCDMAVNTPVTIQYTNGDGSIPALIANNLSAEGYNMSISGSGLYYPYWLAGDTSYYLPAAYSRTMQTINLPLWDFTRYTPEIVILEGGGNDIGGTNAAPFFPDPNNPNVADTTGGFVNAYSGLIQTVRSHYPAAIIIALAPPAACGNNQILLNTTVQGIVHRQNTAGDSNVFYFDVFDTKNASNGLQASCPIQYSCYNDQMASTYGIACEGHFSSGASHVLAQCISAFIRQKIKW